MRLDVVGSGRFPLGRSRPPCSPFGSLVQNRIVSLNPNLLGLFCAELAMRPGQARRVNEHGQQPQGQRGPSQRVSFDRWLLVSVSNPDHGTLHFATTMAGGGHVPLPGGRMEGASVFVRIRRSPGG
jgi:hypothetical protein